jgi:MFS family permease
LPIFIIVLVDLLGVTIIIPLLPLYAISFGASPLVIGLLGAAYPIMQFLGAPVLGRPDSWRRRFVAQDCILFPVCKTGLRSSFF